MSIASEIENLNTNLQAAKSAVTAKGGTVGDTGLAGLAEEIANIPSGGGGGTSFGIDMFLGNGAYGMANMLADQLQEDKVYIGYTNVGYGSCRLSASGMDFDATPYGGDAILVGESLDIFMGKSIAEGIKQVAREAGEDVSPEAVAFCLQYDDRNQTWWGGIGGGTFYEITSAKMSELGWMNSGHFWFTPNSDKKTSQCQWGLPDGYSSGYFVVIELGSGDGIVESYSDNNYVEVDAETFKNDIFPQLFGNESGSQTITVSRWEEEVTIPVRQITYIIIGDGVADSDLPQYQSGAQHFMSNCQYLFLFYGLDRILTHSGDITLGACFLWMCRRFNQPLDLSNVRTINHSFMCYCDSYNQKLVIPANTQFVGASAQQGKYVLHFMMGAFSMCSEIEANSAPFSGGLVNSDKTLSGWGKGLLITRGIEITGPYKDAWLEKFPNKPGSRNLR